MTLVDLVNRFKEGRKHSAYDLNDYSVESRGLPSIPEIAPVDNNSQKKHSSFEGLCYAAGYLSRPRSLYNTLRFICSGQWEGGTAIDYLQELEDEEFERKP